jgi:hypothetical protein
METTSKLIFFIAGLVLLTSILTTVFIIRAVKRRRREEMGEGAGEDEREQVPRGASGENTHEDITYAYKHFRGTDKAPPYFSITIPCTSTGDFTITRESKFDRFFKRLGVCVEINTHDPSFDNTFYISTNTVPFARQYLERGEHRRAIQALFDLGFNHLKQNGKSLVLTWRNFPRRQLMAVETMEKAVVQLAILVRALAKVPSYEPPVSAYPVWKLKRLFAFAVSGILVITGITALIIGLVSYRPLDVGKVFVKSVTYSVPLFFIFSWISLQLLKGRSSSHRELITVFLISLFAFPLAGFGYTAFFNGALDKGEPEVHKVLVINKYYKRNKSTDYYAVVNSWREDTAKKTEKLRISKRFYNLLHPGSSTMMVTTKPGKFGFEWIVNMTSGAD